MAVLSTALSQGTTEAKIRAAEAVHIIVTGFITAKTAPKNATTVLDPFIALLQPLTTNPNPQLQSDAQATIQSIQQLPQVVSSL